MEGKVSGWVKFLLIAFLVVAAAVLGVVVATSYQKVEIGRLETEVTDLKAETVPMRFVVDRRDETSLTVIVKFYDPTNTEVGRLDATLPGQELSVDVLVVPYRDGRLAFPYRLFTNEIAPKDGTPLPQAYGVNGFPVILTQPTNKRQRDAIADIYSVVSTYAEMPAAAFGNAVHEVGKLATFETGVVYKVVVRSSGGVEIMGE